MKRTQTYGLSVGAFLAIFATFVVLTGCPNNTSSGGTQKPATAVASVTLTPETLALTHPTTSQLTTVVAPATATNKAVSYKSSSNSVASVSATGLITTYANGTATITVTTNEGNFTDTCVVTVTGGTAAVSATAVALAPKTMALTIPATGPLVATVTPATATNKTVAYSTSDDKIATVSESGLVTPVAAGIATITVTTVDGAFTDTCAVTVTAAPAAVPVESVTLSPTTMDLTIPATGTLTATVLPATATNKRYTYSILPAGIATVSEAGLVTPVAAGDATITVTTADGSKTATCALKVAAAVPATVPVVSVALDVSTVTLAVGEAKTLVATVTPTNATDKSVRYESSAPEKATVSSAGVVTAVAVGTTFIKVITTDGSKEAICEVTVTAAAPATVPVASVALDVSTVTLAVGETKTLVATVTPTNATDKSVRYESSAPEKATVSSAGVVTAVAVGTTLIKVITTDGSKEATCEITVTAAAPAVVPVTSVTLAPAAKTLAVGAKQPLTATVLPADATNPAVTYSSSDEAIATVSATGEVTAKAVGTATIKATSAADSTKFGSSVITVE